MQSCWAHLSEKKERNMSIRAVLYIVNYCRWMPKKELSFHTQTHCTEMRSKWPQITLLHFGVLRKQRNQTDAHHYSKRRNKCQEKLQLLPELVDVQQRPEQLVPQWELSPPSPLLLLEIICVTEFKDQIWHSWSFVSPHFPFSFPFICHFQIESFNLKFHSEN
jgi:hypothetical protein